MVLVPVGPIRVSKGPAVFKTGSSPRVVPLEPPSSTPRAFLKGRRKGSLLTLALEPLRFKEWIRNQPEGSDFRSACDGCCLRWIHFAFLFNFFNFDGDFVLAGVVARVQH